MHTPKFYDKLLMVVKMKKKTKKIAAWAMLIIMVASVIAGFLAYIRF